MRLIVDGSSVEVRRPAGSDAVVEVTLAPTALVLAVVMLQQAGAGRRRRRLLRGAARGQDVQRGGLQHGRPGRLRLDQ
jgi:hypothetical protein